MVDKVYAYITHGERLLVFRQPASPAAGIQIPGGTMEPGETPQTAVLREAYEETGLNDLVIHCYLGCSDFDLRPHGHNKINRRHFFHLVYRGDPPETWRHFERTPNSGETEPIEFTLFWVDWPGRTPHRRATTETLLATMVWHG
jgi:8-oxo-dGTP pyrophosphatase MutT (NUDIX family)